MNIKVIIVWAFAIVILAGIGVFGWVNQDLLVEQDKEVYAPGDVGAKNNVCSKSFENADSSYTFQVNPDTNEIEKIIMTYNSKSTNLNAHTAATAIYEADITGIESILNGNAGSFVFVVTVDLASLDLAKVESMSAEFQQVAMIIDKLTDYDAYVNAINESTTGDFYVCR